MSRIAACLLSVAALASEPNKIDRAKVIQDQLHHLRSLPDAERATVTRQLAIEIRTLSAADGREGLALDLANLATEGDFGRDTLQKVTTTLEQALAEQPGGPEAYVTLAQLARYEHMQVALDSLQLRIAMAQLEEDDRARQWADFTLTDLNGNSWTLTSLTGKVVLVNFWATWCPPCRKEMPDLEVLYQRFKGNGLVILAISDEVERDVKPFLANHKFSYPVLLDPGRRVNDLFRVQGIPKSFLYDRTGSLVAEAIDMRTRAQFLDMLGRAGLK
jgi:thiol-disulfide isomerase/thioredoxin